MLRAPVRPPDTEPSAFEAFSGVLLDGTSIDDAIDFRATIARYAEFGGANADADTAAWLAGADI